MSAVIVDLDAARARRFRRRKIAGEVCALCETDTAVVVVAAGAGWQVVWCATCAAECTVETPA